MTFKYYGHSCFSVELEGKTILFDPFIKPNELAKSIDLQAIKCDYICISHGHADHIADAVELASLNPSALVISNWEVCDWLSKKGVTNTMPMNTGGSKDFEFGNIKCVVAQHSSSLPDGTYGGNPMGFLVQSKRKSFYYSGDTALTLDMELIPRYWAKPDVCLLPIGDHFTMGFNDAAIAMELLQSNVCIALHYDTFGYIVVNHNEAIEYFKSKNLDLKMLSIGESILI